MLSRDPPHMMLNLKRPLVVWMMPFLYLLNSKISIYNVRDQVHVCINPVITYSPCCFSLEIKNSTSLGGGCTAASTRGVFTPKHDGHLLLSQPQRLQHRRHTSLRLFLTQPTTTLYFWTQELTGHIALKSIFLLLWRSKRPLLMCICPALQLRSLSVIAAPRRVQPLSLIRMNFCPLLKHAGLMIVPRGLWRTERKADLLCEHQSDRSESDCVCVKEFLWGPVEILGRLCPFRVRKRGSLYLPCVFHRLMLLRLSGANACQLFNGNHK